MINDTLKTKKCTIKMSDVVIIFKNNFFLTFQSLRVCPGISWNVTFSVAVRILAVYFSSRRHYKCFGWHYTVWWCLKLNTWVMNTVVITGRVGRVTSTMYSDTVTNYLWTDVDVIQVSKYDNIKSHVTWLLFVTFGLHQ